MVASVLVHASTRAHTQALEQKVAALPSYLVQADMPQFYRRPCGRRSGKSGMGSFARSATRRRRRSIRSSELGWQIKGAHGGGGECTEALGSIVFAEDVDRGNADRARH